MPSSSTRQRVEIPLDLYQALNQAAADAAMPTSALVTMWLLHLLQIRRPDLHVRDPYRNGIEQFERRPRRPGELPDDRSFAELLTPHMEEDEPAPTGAEVPPTNLTTVSFSPLEGGLRALADPSVRPPAVPRLPVGGHAKSKDVY